MSSPRTAADRGPHGTRGGGGTGSGGGSGDRGGGAGDCDCDLGAIDDLACAAKGIQRRAEITQEHLPQPREFQEKFNSVRTEYAAARHTAQVDLDAAAGILDRVREQNRCRIAPEQRHCLREAVEEVFEEVRE
ncbi:hypothetical protein [Streptomyces sp. G-G2]|uniref:hypothetical protein n=1 Tax=Streptomyces sp. G-G2 TaxID=3046201 RepID=UPI0024BB65A6|nr:hypothetical protein [Streptomyces sp. G-G2]MDJ0380017.1 hypothetical protein [Streptomyces sp. G-G2]